jgi:ribosomal protein S28E/S33
MSDKSRIEWFTRAVVRGVQGPVRENTVVKAGAQALIL